MSGQSGGLLESQTEEWDRGSGTGCGRRVECQMGGLDGWTGSLVGLKGTPALRLILLVQ